MTAVFPTGSTQVFAPVSRLSVLAAELAESPLGPRAEFRQDLRSRLLDEAVQRGRLVDSDLSSAATTGAPVPRVGRGGRRAAAIGLAAALVAGAATTAAAAETVPGDALYPVKRFTESVRTAIDPPSGAPAPTTAPASRPTAARPAAEAPPVRDAAPSPVARPRAPEPARAPSARPGPSVRDRPVSRSGSSGTATERRSADVTAGTRDSSSSVTSTSVTPNSATSKTSRATAPVAAPTLRLPERKDRTAAGDGASADRIVGDAADSLRGLPVLGSLSGS